MTEIHTQFDGDNHGHLSEESQSTCFICAKYLSAFNDQDQNYDRKLFVRTIFRHLKINHKVQLNNCYNQPDDFVSFCERCCQILKTLSKYCADLEVLQMQIRYFFDKLNKLIVVDKTKPNFSAVEELKRKVEGKCTNNSQNGPLVMLTQLDDEQFRKVANQIKDSNIVSLTEGDSEPPVEKIETSDNTLFFSDMEDESETNRSSKSSTSTSIAEEGLASTSNKTLICVECDREFKSKHSLLEHSHVFHPEQHFPSTSKSDDSTISQHKMYLTHLLNTEIDSCGSWKCGYKCVYCSKAFEKRRKSSLRLHLIDDHQNRLLEKLLQLQKDVSNELIANIVKMPIPSRQKEEVPETDIKLKQFCKTKNRMRLEHTCSMCGVCTTSRRQHDALHHPERFLFLKRSKDVSTEQFKMYCVYLLNKLVENFTKSQQDKKVRFHCPQCKNSYMDLQSCRNHLLFNHLDHLSHEVEKLQQNMEPEELKKDKAVKRCKARHAKRIKGAVEIRTNKCEICDVRLTKRGMTFHMRKSHPNEHSQIYNCKECLICNEIFSYKWSFNYHTTRYHADVLFEKWKAARTTGEQFKTYCEYIVETEISGLVEMVCATDGKLRYQCSYCTTTCSDSKYARVHLVMEHKEMLAGKLVELQQSKIVGEKEQESISIIGREESDKNIDEEDGFEATEVFCDKSVAKQESIEITCKNDNEMEDLGLNDARLGNLDLEIKEEDFKLNADAILPY